MINKSLVKLRFEKSLKTYDENALIQKLMAKKLVSMLKKKRYNSVFEAGCSTGILTREVKNNIEFENYHANDIVEKSNEYFKSIIPEGIFYNGDIEEINIQGHYDLIISNACLQWCSDIKSTADKLYSSLNEGGTLAISVFGSENLKEIKKIFDISNGIPSTKEFIQDLSEYNFINIKEDINELLFDTPLDVLKHLKYTGVNAIQNYTLTKSKLKHFEEQYNNLYSRDGKVYLTYNPIYIVLEKFENYNI